VARLSSSQRADLADRAFAYVDSQGNRRLPIHDAAHVRNALARFGQVRFDDDASRNHARTRLLRAAKRFRIVPIGFIASEFDAGGSRSAGPLPVGFVTMMMTDVEGSTALVQQLGGRFGELIDAVWGELRTAVKAVGGREVEARADEFFAVFDAPRAGVDAAIAVQRALASTSFADGTMVRLRIGVHSGYPTPRPGNYVGLDVNITSRISAAGHGGQIIVSTSTRDAVRSTGASGLRFVSLGTHSLRGVSEPQALYQVGASGVARHFPPLRL
jgi:class 3 adenylate cyclase